MSDRFLRPVDTGGKLLPFLDYRIMQHEACISDHFDEAWGFMERADRFIGATEFGRASDAMASAGRKLREAAGMHRAMKELEWVRQHPKFTDNSCPSTNG
jgi:hypothetical protein